MQVIGNQQQPIICGPQKNKLEDQEPREQLADGMRYSGTVQSYNWNNGIGWIETKDDLPEAAKEKMKKWKKTIWFHRDDLFSTDKVFGVPQGSDVEFSLYTDKKGLGACFVSKPFFKPFSNCLFSDQQKTRKRKFVGGHLENRSGKKKVQKKKKGGQKRKAGQKNNSRKKRKMIMPGTGYTPPFYSPFFAPVPPQGNYQRGNTPGKRGWSNNYGYHGSYNQANNPFPMAFAPSPYPRKKWSNNRGWNGRRGWNNNGRPRNNQRNW